MMDQPATIADAFDVVAAAFMDRGQLTNEREAELGHALGVIGASVVTSLDRMATALETLAGELAHPEWGVAPTLRQRP